MSDNRKVLVAKRKHQRNANRSDNFKNVQESDNSKKGTKRPVFPSDSGKKNLANDRLKRLRTSLNEQAQNEKPNPTSLNQRGKCNPTSVNQRAKLPNPARKRPQYVKENVGAAKLPRQEAASTSANFVFKEENLTVRSFETTSKTNPFAFSSASRVFESCNEEDMEWSTVDNESGNITFDRKNYIVVDTNIFLSQLQIIKGIIAMEVDDNIQPVIYIPWIVLEELDFIKSDSKKTHLRLKAQEANKFIENTFSNGNHRIKGQTVAEANQQASVGKSQDDKIIAACLQLLSNNEQMILLTNDINLRNKAYFNSIPTCSHSEIMSKLSHSDITKEQLINRKMTNLCGQVIQECARNAYGLATKSMPISKSPLNTMQDCISVFTKYWFPVFQEVLMKQFKKAIDDLATFLTKNKCIKDGSNELNDLLRLCVRVCLFLKDVEGCKDSIENTIRDLNNIKDL